MNEITPQLTVEKEHDFYIRILGRMLEHLGVQMYKRRDAAIAELVANCWDAGANNVWLEIPVPETYNQSSSVIRIEDDGSGMDVNDMQDKYLVIGRNRRQEELTDESFGRKVMGRKGIGKLAGFGIANLMKIETWKTSTTISLTLDLDALKSNPKEENINKKIIGTIIETIPSNINGKDGSGTRITLSGLKQPSSLDISSLHTSLARRFSRTVQGIMNIYINGNSLVPYEMILHPNSRKTTDEVLFAQLEDGNTVKYNYVFTEKPISFNELRGWTILVNGKTAQAPNFFFNVDADGSFQHSSKYLSGWIEADFLDIGIDENKDFVSTDRQEIDWERQETKGLWN